MATAGKNLSAYNKEELSKATEFKFGLVVSEWNDEITENLYKGAIEVFTDLGVEEENILRWNVPGSFELVYGSKRMIQSHPELDAVIAIGNVIQGDTKHFDFVCEGVTQGIKDLNLQYDTPVVFCVLTDNTKQQSIDRSGGKHGNKGSEAAVVAIKMAQLRKDSAK